MKRSLGSLGFAVLVSALVLGGIAIQPVRAAVITWGSATTIAGDTDVITTGTFVAATNFYGNSVTVNGVTFASFPGSPFTTQTQPSGNNLSVYGSFNGGTTPFTTLSTNYKTLLQQGSYSSNSNSNTVTVSGLTVGQQYLFQFWTNDSRTAGSTRTTTLTSGANAVSLRQNTTALDGGVGQWVSGTFTADATTQSFVGSGANQLYTAMQVRAVPEPETLAGIGVIGSCLAAVIRRRLQPGVKSAS